MSLFLFVSKKKVLVSWSCGRAINGEWQGFVVAEMGIPCSSASSSCCSGSVKMRNLGFLYASYLWPVTRGGGHITWNKKQQHRSRRETHREIESESNSEKWWKSLLISLQWLMKNVFFVWFDSLCEGLFSVLKKSCGLDCSFASGLRSFPLTHAHTAGHCGAADLRAEKTKPISLLVVMLIFKVTVF